MKQKAGTGIMMEDPPGIGHDTWGDDGDQRNNFDTIIMRQDRPRKNYKKYASKHSRLQLKGTKSI